MHGTPYEQAVALSREGRFRDALQALSGTEMRLENVTLQTLRAELLDETGAYVEAGELAASIRRSRQLDRVLTSRCEIVIGHVAQMAGRIEDARDRYRAAIFFATASGDLEQLCWAQLRLLNSMRSMLDEPSVLSLLSELRRNAARLGSPTLSCALHARVATAEGERGALGSAARHLKIAQSILAHNPNLWLSAGTETTAAVLHYVRDDLFGALAHGTRALELARRSGSAFETVCALGNLGHFCLFQGRSDTAQQYFEEGLRSAVPGGSSEAALTDGLARSHLLNGHFDSCDRLLARIEEMTSSWKERFPYHFRWSQPTLVRAALWQGRRDDAIRLATRALGIAEEASDSRLQALMLALSADATSPADSGTREQLLARSLRLRDRSVEVFGELERVLGKALAEAGAIQPALAHFARAMRAFDSVGHVVAKGAFEWVDRIPLAMNASDAVQVALEPSHSRRAPDDYLAEETLAGVAALTLLCENPEMYGRETLALLRATNCARAARLECVDMDGVRQLVDSWDAGVEAAPLSSLESEQAFRIALGETHKGKFELWACSGAGLLQGITFQNVRCVVHAGLELQELRAQHRRAEALWPLEDQGALLDDLPGVFAGGKIQELLDLVRRTASMHINVLVTGETGTGKELIARLIHEWSPRAKQPFVPFNCSAVPRDMLDAQLFGHKRGAFTGAVDSFQGIIRGANGGTLFLDEIGEIAVELQPKLLRFLESAEVHPIGEARPTKVDVRVVAATNADLDLLVKEKRFREDLFYRLNVLQIRLPPLRERRDEIPLLARHFLEKHSAELGRSDLRISGEALEFLALRDWPGNIRELSNTIRRAVALAGDGAVLMPDHVCSQANSGRPSEIGTLKPHPRISVGLEQSLVSAFQQVERAMLAHAIKRTGGQMEEAARLLGLSRKGLYLKRQRLGVEI